MLRSVMGAAMHSHLVDIFNPRSKRVVSYPISSSNLRVSSLSWVAASEADYKSDALRLAVEDGEILERDVPLCSLRVRRAPAIPEPSWR
jgi:hypothetical protein